MSFEPYAVGMAGLWVPETGIVDFVRVAETYRQLLEARGGQIVFGARLNSVVRDGSELLCLTTRGDFRARNLVNAAGLYSDRVAISCGPGARRENRSVSWRILCGGA